MNTESFDGIKSIHSAKRGVQRDVVHRANASTPPMGRFDPPKAGFPWSLDVAVQIEDGAKLA
jgi:hypothetical protein